MTKNVIHEGVADVLILDASDFKKAGVEHKKTTFLRGEPVTVPDEVADALLSEEGIFHDFEFSEGEPVEDEKAKDNDSGSETDTSSASTSSAGTSTTSGRGRGSRSTAGSTT